MPQLGADVTVKVDFLGSQVNALALAVGLLPIDYEARYDFSNGTGPNEAAQIFSDKRTLAASASESLTLNASSLVDAFGAAINLTEIKALIIKADPGNTNDVVIGAAGSDPIASIMGTTGTVNVKPGGCAAFIAPNGYAVVASTAMNLQVANSGGGTGIKYTVIVLGC